MPPIAEVGIAFFDAEDATFPVIVLNFQLFL